jgi:hypothetical protein
MELVLEGALVKLFETLLYQRAIRRQVTQVNAQRDHQIVGLEHLILFAVIVNHLQILD